MEKSTTIPLAIIIGGLIIAGAVYVTVAKPSTGPEGTVSKPELIRPVDSTDHILGNPAAPIKIVEYSDFSCQFCKGFDETLHQIIATEGADGSVAWVYRHFPLTELHPNALKQARAAECAAVAGGNDAFWKLGAILFKNQPADPAKFGTYANEAGLGESFSSCLAGDTKAIDERIAADRKNAMDMGARGTPFSVILVEGKAPVVLDGAQPYDLVKQALDQAKAQ
jgi:protein-disulfide isomerase